MAVKESGKVQLFVEKLITNPLHATFTVGFSILCLLQLIEFISSFVPELKYLKFIVPFIPPFFITRTAKIVNQKRAEHNFIEDAESYLFVSFPKAATAEALLSAKPDMVSAGAGKYLNCPPADLIQMEALPANFITEEQRKRIINKLIADYEKNGDCGIIHYEMINLTSNNSETIRPFILSSVLKLKKGQLKWQATLVEHESQLKK